MSGSTALARVNLNLPVEARSSLRALAKAAGQPEAAYARELLLSALHDAERAALRRKLEESRTPELRKRERQILRAMERLRG